MGKVMISIKTRQGLVERARDAVYCLQGPPEHLTLAALASDSIETMIRVAEKKNGGPFPSVPAGYQAGRMGRRAGKEIEPGGTLRRVFSFSLTEEQRGRAWAVAWGLQETSEFATLFEDALEAELLKLTGRHGEIAERPTAGLRRGRRVK